MSLVEVGYASGVSAMTERLVAKPAKKTAEFSISLPDQSVYSFKLPPNSTGQDCLDQICDVLGIIEKDYFSLQYVDKATGCNIWLNKRLQVREQIGGGRLRRSYKLKFAVRFYTDLELLLQPTTIEAFYKDLKYQIKRGEIRIPDGKKSIVGAQLAQAEFGDYELLSDSPTNSLTFVYPPYYPEEEWNDGIAHLIAKEHKKLKGVIKRDAQLLFIREIYQNEFYGMVYVPSTMSDGQDVVLAVGAKFIRVYNTRWTCIKKISYQSLCQIAFALRFFILTYQTRDEEYQLVEKKLKLVLPCRRVAKSLFRMIAEEQVFFFQQTVSEKIINHTDNTFKKWKKFYHKMLRKKFRPNYYYDIQRTKNEAYRHSWQVLHQVSDAAASALDILIPQPNSLNFTNINLVNESDEEEDITYANASAKSEVCWGLSVSSCNLAKELLAAHQLSLGDSMENLLLLSKMESKNSKKTDEEAGTDADDLALEDRAEPLSGAQGKKLCQFLLKIQDERLCAVCMDELICCVFCPCGHYVSCSKCAKRLDKCPLCRQPVGYVQHVYNRF